MVHPQFQEDVQSRLGVVYAEGERAIVLVDTLVKCQTAPPDSRRQFQLRGLTEAVYGDAQVCHL